MGMNGRFTQKCKFSCSYCKTCTNALLLGLLLSVYNMQDLLENKIIKWITVSKSSL
jgi:hypothetical protein